MLVIQESCLTKKDTLKSISEKITQFINCNLREPVSYSFHISSSKSIYSSAVACLLSKNVSH